MRPWPRTSRTPASASIYRIHEKPDPKRVMEFEEVAAHFGYSLGVGAIPVKKFGMTDRHRDGAKRRREIVLADRGMNISSRHYQRLVAKIEGKPEERILSYLMLRSLKQARYSTENVGHFALAAPTYTHFTSPIRRYPDLLVHRLLRDRGGQMPPARGGTAVPSPRSARNRSGARPMPSASWWSGRRSSSWPSAWARISTRSSSAPRKYGLFVELADLFIEGLVPIDTPAGRRVHLSGERAQGGGQAHAARILHRRSRARDPRPRGR